MEKTKRLFPLDWLRKIIMKIWKSKTNYLIKMDKLKKMKQAMMMKVLKKYAMLFSKLSLKSQNHKKLKSLRKMFV